MIRIKFFVIIISLICFNSLLAADHRFLAHVNKRHESVRDALWSYNKLRIERSQLFEDSVGEQTVADGLPEELLNIVSKVHILFQKSIMVNFVSMSLYPNFFMKLIHL